MATKYRLTADPYQEQDKHGNNILKRVRFTALDGDNKKHVIDLDVSEQGIDGTIIVLLAATTQEAGIRANQALKRGEKVDLGRYDAEDLAEIGFEDLEP